MIKRLLLLSALAFGIGCSSTTDTSDPQNNNNNNSGVTIGRDSIRFTINDTLTVTMPVLTTTFNPSDKVLVLDGRNTTGFFRPAIYDTVVRTATHTISDGYTVPSATATALLLADGYVAVPGSGALKVTWVSGMEVKGTFNLKMYSFSKDTIRITNGQFYVRRLN